jgi:hypothetical protein
MTFPSTALTAISGGINRLRTKGGADKNSLFDLLNGYVTQTGTVKVREGTFRNANIATYSGAGKTAGLMSYQSQLHVFGNTVVPVPPGYALHVINHPAALQSVSTNNKTNVTTVVTAGIGNVGAFPFAGSWWVRAGAGFADIAQTPPFPSGSGGSATVVSINGAALGTISAASDGSVFNPSVSGPVMILCLPAGLPQNFFDSITVTKSGGTPHTFTSTSATFNPVATGSGNISSQTTWVWSLGAGTVPTYFVNGITTTVLFTNAGSVTTTFNPIPIQEINFSAPYLGGIYVVATFAVSDPVVLAQYGATYHFWIQSSSGGGNANTWSASTDYTIGQVVIPTVPNGLTYIAGRRLPPNPLWQPNVAEVVNNIVEPTIANGFQYAATALIGATPTTGAVEPTWPTSDGATVQENSSTASDQTVTIAQPAAATPPTAIPAKYSGTIAGGFGG